MYSEPGLGRAWKSSGRLGMLGVIMMLFIIK